MSLDLAILDLWFPVLLSHTSEFGYRSSNSFALGVDVSLHIVRTRKSAQDTLQLYPAYQLQSAAAYQLQSADIRQV